MKKFKITDNATFVFQHTFSNLKEFIKYKQKLLYVFILSILITSSAGLILGYPLYNSIEDKTVQIEVLEEEMSRISDKEGKSIEEVEIIEKQEAEISYKIEVIGKEVLSDMKSNIPSIIVIILMIIIYNIIAMIVCFEWLRYCMKVNFSPSLIKNIWFMIKMALISFGYIVIPAVLMISINILLFLVNPLVGALGILLWIPLSVYMVSLSPALAMRYLQIITGKEEESVIGMMMSFKGNIFRFLMVSFMIGVVFMFINYAMSIIIGMSMVVIDAFAVFIVSFIFSALIMILEKFASFTLYYAYYKGLIEEDKKFLL